MKKVSAAIFSLLAFAVTALAGPYDTWTKYRSITVNTRASGGGAAVATTQTDFPVLVRLTAANAADVLSEAQAGGVDIRFSNSTGQTALAFEIEQWSPTAAAIWVRVPVVEGHADNDIRLYWGNGSATPVSNASAVFGSNNFLGVWHMGNTSGAAERPNAVNNGAANNAVPAGPNTAAQVPVLGLMGMADSMKAQGNGASGDHFSMGSITYPNTQTTMSLWMNMPDPQANSGFTHFMTMGNNSTSHVLWFGREGTTNWRARGAGGSGGGGTTGETDNEAFTTVADALLPMATWMNLAVTRDSTNGRRWRMYKNGVMVADYFRGTGTANADNRHNFGATTRSTHYLGRPVGWNDPTTHMVVDEARISSIARSPEWIKLEYELQKPAATAVSVGATVANAVKAITYSSRAPKYVHEKAITANEPAVHESFTAPLSYAVSPALPAGLTLNTTTGAITGTPNGVLAATQYVVTATFASGVGRDTLMITVNPAAPTALVYPATTLVYGQNVAIAANTPTVNSLSNPNYMVETFTVNPALPAGLLLNPANGQITGTPTVASVATNYTVTARNAAGSTSQVLNITVLAAPTGLSYLQDPATYDAGLPITGNKPSITGTVFTWKVQSGSLPAGLTLDTLTGSISGTPTSAGTGAFTIRASNLAGFVDEEVSYTINAAENYATWSNVKTFNLNTSAAAAGLTEAQANFPVLVRLTAAHAAIFTAAKGDGADIRFSLPDGTRLPYEIERWDDVGQKAEIWVLVPNVNPGVTTAVRMHYGNVSANSKSNGGAVFNNTNNYVAVWHLGNAAGIDPRPSSVVGAPSAKPSNNFAGGQFGGGSGTYVAPDGAIGKADALRGGGNRNTPTATSDYLNIGTAADNTSSPYTGNNTYAGYSDFSNGYTYSVWANVGAHSNFTYFTTLANLTNGNDNIHVFRPDGTGQRVRFEQMNGTAGGGLITTNNAVLTQGGWSYVSVTVQPTETFGTNAVSIYANGVLAGGGNATQRPRVINRTNAWIGKSNWTGDTYIAASFDEPRYSNVARSANWVKLEYVNQKPGTTPVTDLAYSAPSYTFVEESAITPVAAPTLLGTATRFSIAPALPAGLVLNTSTGGITGTPLDASAAQVYTVTAFGDSAWSTTGSFTLAVTSLPPAGLQYSSMSPTYRVGVEIASNVPTHTGTITSWTISPALPTGLSLNTSTGIITGVPLSASANASYKVVGTGPDGKDSANIQVTVLPPTEDFTTWGNNRSIVLNTSATGSNVSGTVTGFPVLVRLGQAEAAIFSQALAGGADVRFSKSNGVTRLPYEIVSWTAAPPSAEIWVRVDTVYGNNSTQSIKMYWGKGGAADSSSPGSVFSASNGFSAVWHMEGLADNEPDATSNGFLATAVGAPVDTVGMIGRSRNLNGTSQHFVVANSASGELDYQMTDNYTLSSWVYVGGVPAVANSGVQILNKGDNQYTLAAYDGAASPKYWEITTRGNNTYLQARSNGGIVTTANSHIGSWRLITGTYKGASVGGAIAESLYIDGVLINTLASTNSNNTGRNTGFNVHIGALVDGTTPPGTTYSRRFVGNLDEVRMAKATRSRDWVRLDYESQKTYQTLTNIGYQAPVLAYAADSVSGAAGFPMPEVALTITGTVSAPLSISPALPSGLTFNTTTGAITGTPNVLYASTVHTVTATNNGATATETIVVTVVAPTLPTKAVIVSPTQNATNVAPSSSVVWNRVAPPVTNYRLQGSDDSTFATVDLDTLVTDTSFVLSFAPFNSRVHVRVRANNVAGSGPWSDSVSFTTIIAPPSITYATPRSLIKGVADSLVVTSTGGAVASYAVAPALPAGLTLNTTTGRIGGTPTAVSAAANYTIVATNATGTDTMVVSIAVVDLTPVISYANTTLSYTVGTAANTASISTGGPVTSWSITPALPAGLVFSTTTGNITGTPTAAAVAANRTVVATNAYGADTVILNVTVLPGLPVIAYAGTPKTFIKGVVDSLVVSSTGGVVASYAVAPALPAGLTLNTTTGRISGNATAASAAANYTVTATNASGTATATVNIQVQDLTPVVSYAAVTDSFTVGIAVTKNATSTGGAVTAWSVTPALPAGLTLSTTTGSITGNPTAATAAANYMVIATNAYGADTVILNLKVIPSTAIMGGAYTFRVSGVEKPYTFVLPAGAATTEKVTMRITDVWGRTVWTRTVRPDATGAAMEVVWTGRTATGMLASAGMYVVRVSVLDNGKTTDYVQKSVTLKSR